MYIFDTQVIVYIMLVRLMSGSPVCIIWLCMIMILYNVCIIIYYYMFTKNMKKKWKKRYIKYIHYNIYVHVYKILYTTWTSVYLVHHKNGGKNNNKNKYILLLYRVYLPFLFFPISFLPFLILALRLDFQHDGSNGARPRINYPVFR